ncbi:DUF397 domain-containing protein [Haloactinomyces albus]|uniref:DUF397 domain-containing protein n=1 Tax=Haloactinomyces albus TaxID=1352928 RepID=A0AAE3ZAU8_9ACTN|nr:DUF397 domain-containing protein [Haloactinomyces albus]MDR7301506.1 hypothetical protein [Haloactinomyces albus]
MAVAPRRTAVRDTKDRDGGMLVFGEHAWSGFLTAVKTDRYNA